MDSHASNRNHARLTERNSQTKVADFRETGRDTFISIGVAAGDLVRKLEQMRDERARKG
jgi:hypothetical protein